MIKRVLVLLAISSLPIWGYSQGCSDAGFCTMGSMSGIQGEDKLRNEVKFVFGYEMGEKSTNLFIPQIQGKFNMDDNNQIQIKIPYVIASGSLGSNSGLGDFQMSYSHRFYNKKDFSVSATAGVRIASGNADDAIDGKDLPMPYQPSLGTYDFMAGMNFKYTSWAFAFGVQIPAIQQNDNQYSPLEWPNESAYFESTNLIRKPDVMLRVEKAFETDNALFKVGILPIYHLANDEMEVYSDTTSLNTERIEIENSAGLTLNITAGGSYKFNEHWVADIQMGFPIITREVRPDGLTRSFVIRPGIAYRF